MVFQDPDAQVVTGTLLDEVAFGPENRLVPAAEVLERAERALKLVGLWDRRADNPDGSPAAGGSGSRSPARSRSPPPCWCSTSRPRTSTRRASTRCTRCSASSPNERDHAIVLVEHNLDAAVDLVDRVIVLDAAGRLVIDGPVRDVLQGRAGELLELGVWLPVSTLAAMRLRSAGVTLDPLPLTPAELAAALEAIDALPSPAPAVARAATTTLRAADAAEPAPAAAITVRDCSVQRGGRRGPIVVDGVDLDVASGDFLAIVGTNGAGKTTLLQAIAGVIPPPRGSVDVLGMDPARADARDRARRIGFVFQNPEHQFVAHTVADELEVEPAAAGRARARAPRRGRADAATLRPRRAPRPASVPALGRAEATPLGRHGPRRRRPGARPRRADVRPGPRPRGGAPRPPARVELRRHDRARRHPRPAAGRRLRRPGRRDAGRPRARRPVPPPRCSRVP